MRPETRDPAKRAEAKGHHYELWSRRPLAGWSRTACSKKLSRKLHRVRLKRELNNADTHD